MEGPLKELEKLENLTALRGKTPLGPLSITDILDELILCSLKEAKEHIAHAGIDEDAVRHLARVVGTKTEVDERQKEVYASISQLGGVLDKKFLASLPTHYHLFEPGESKAALQRTIALHFLRTGQFDTAETFLEESGIKISSELRVEFVDLHQILRALRNQDIGPALEWTRKNQTFLQSRSSPLEFYLHRSQYIRLLLSSHPPDPLPAISYAKTTLRPFYIDHNAEFQRLVACVAYLPLSKLQTSQYADLISPSLYFDLELLFATEYCASSLVKGQVI